MFLIGVVVRTQCGGAFQKHEGQRVAVAGGVVFGAAIVGFGCRGVDIYAPAVERECRVGVSGEFLPHRLEEIHVVGAAVAVPQRVACQHDVVVLTAVVRFRHACQSRDNGRQSHGHQGTQGYGAEVWVAYSCVHFTPVCPYPPVPRSVSSSSATTSNSPCSWRATTICAMRSPAVITKSSVERFISSTPISPR